MMNKTIIIALLAALCLSATAQKREFRGAWIQCVNGQFQGMSMGTMQNTLSKQLDELQRDGVNAIIFQVRAECDALYESELEPWSRFLTGTQGRAPQPYWDPLAWMVEQCHNRGMEIHAWINPYRAKTKFTNALASNHIAITKPQSFFSYDGLYILNPALPENSEYICKVAKDIVRRYDIDGFHIDDYFYPYPVAGEQIPDSPQYNAYRKQAGHNAMSIGDWRRENVSTFIRQLHYAIRSVKPWVRFGVSPFGIYRNRKNDPDGSNTNGLQNYDDLYADVLKWVDKGWVDYVVPQLYWEIGHKAANYAELLPWWDSHVSKRPLYIGEDIERTANNADPQNPGQNQLPAKMRMKQQAKNVKGTVLWYAKAAVDNVGNYGGMLRNVYWRTPALQPVMPFIDGKAPKKVRNLKMMRIDGNELLFWTKPRGKGWKNEAVRYVVYWFAPGQPVDISDGNHILTITSQTFVKVVQPGTYVVTSLDRASNESKGKNVKYYQ